MLIVGLLCFLLDFFFGMHLPYFSASPLAERHLGSVVILVGNRRRQAQRM